MSIYSGKCKGCNQDCNEIYEFNDKCMICTRLDNLEANLLPLKESRKVK